MAPSIPVGVPERLVAGDTWKWKIADQADYPESEGWQLNYSVVGEDTLSLDDTEVVFQSSGDHENHWLITVPPANTNLMRDGHYEFRARMVGSGSYDGEEYSISKDDVLILPDPRIAKAGDFQTFEERMVAALRASCEAGVTDENLIESYGIAGRQIAKMSIQRRINLLRQLEAAEERKRRPNRVVQTAGVKFGIPG
jgi:hypothetical protein